jgi:hypothetical protein
VIKSRRMGWVGNVACTGGGKGAYRVLVRRPDCKRPLGKPRVIGKDNIKMKL